MSGKSDSGRRDTTAIIISILSLIISIVFSGYSLIIANQAYDVAEKSFELQNIVLNFTSTIVPSPNQRVFLDGVGYYSIGVQGSSNPYGYANFSLTAITPHYGNLSVEVENFSAYTDMLDPEKVNLTNVSSYPYDKYEAFTVPGLNQLTPSLYLSATLYPNPEKFRANSNSTFPLGVLFLKAELFDLHTQLSTSKEFSAIIFVTIKTF